MMFKKTIGSIITNRVLIWEMTKKDLKGLNQGAMLGYLWVFINPLIHTGIYVIVVSYVFKTRLNPSAGPLDYAIYVLGGMIPWQIITKSLQDAPSVIRTRIELVKQVIYPIETLPFSNLIVGSFGSLISLVIFLGLCLISGNVHWTLILLPAPVILLVLFLMGVSWLFSIVGIILKDLREMVTVFLSLIIYLSPVVVNENIVSPKLWSYIMLNPLAHIIVCFRDVYNSTFHLTSWIVFLVLTIISLLLGGWMITKFKIKINEYI
jgi:lipopolysaccharide transport system permease protein